MLKTDRRLRRHLNHSGPSEDIPNGGLGSPCVVRACPGSHIFTGDRDVSVSGCLEVGDKQSDRETPIPNAPHCREGQTNSTGKPCCYSIANRSGLDQIPLRHRCQLVISRQPSGDQDGSNPPSGVSCLRSVPSALLTHKPVSYEKTISPDNAERSTGTET